MQHHPYFHTSLYVWLFFAIHQRYTYFQYCYISPVWDKANPKIEAIYFERSLCSTWQNGAVDVQTITSAQQPLIPPTDRAVLDTIVAIVRARRLRAAFLPLLLVHGQQRLPEGRSSLSAWPPSLGRRYKKIIWAQMPLNFMHAHRQFHLSLGENWNQQCQEFAAARTGVS